MRLLSSGARPLALTVALLGLVASQQLRQDDGYEGYSLQQHGDPASARYRTLLTDTAGGVELPLKPDVRLNASVSVDEISIQVDNITAKVNLDAQVLKLLKFTAGVDASIDRVRLSIQNVSARVELEARLGNIVQMVNDVLHSIDLNPIVATLGNSVGRIVDTVGDTLGAPVDENGDPRPSSPSSSPAAGGAQPTPRNRKRDLEYNVAHNILYSVNDYTGRAHRNRILAQNGSVYDVYLDNNGDEQGRRAVGLYSRDMTFSGHNRTLSIDGVAVEYEMQYLYNPYVGLEVVALIYMDARNGRITRTKVIAEAEGGGGSTISNDADQ